MTDYAGSSSVAVAAAATAVLEPRFGKRKALSISNDGAVKVYVCLSNQQVAASGVGIPLAAGAAITDSANALYECWQGRITAYEGGGAGTLRVWERVEL